MVETRDVYEEGGGNWVGKFLKQIVSSSKLLTILVIYSPELPYIS